MGANGNITRGEVSQALETAVQLTDEPATCQWRISSTSYYIRFPGFGTCQRQLDGNHPTLCILHDPNPDKDRDRRFSFTLHTKILADAENDTTHIDLSGVVVPAGTTALIGKVFNKDTSFYEARFIGKVDFRGVHFSGNVDFEGAQFGGQTTFGTFGVPSTRQFNGSVNFSRVIVRESLVFQGSTFLHAKTNWSASFQDLIAESARRIRFEGVDLSSVSFLRTDVNQIQFVGCKWAKKNGRNIILDEVIWPTFEASLWANTHRSLIADLYRQLRLNYESNRQEAEAGDFYIGQMEMRRQDRASYSWLYRGLLSVYRVLAMYGESYQRPVFF